MCKYLNPDDVPHGWRHVVESLDDEIQNVINQGGISNYRVVQLKEKYGTLRLYDEYNYEYEEQRQRLQDLNAIYEGISEHTCAYCGKYPSRVLKYGWILPVCEECYGKHVNQGHTYEEATYPLKDNCDTYEVEIWKAGETRTIKYNLKPFLNKIEELKHEV